MGGALKAIERGYIQNEIQNAAYIAQRPIENGEQIVVGVNQFQVDEEMTLERLKVDPAIEAAQGEVEGIAGTKKPETCGAIARKADGSG